MFNYLRIPAFLLAFVFLFFGSSSLSFAAENPSRLISRLDALSPSASKTVFAGDSPIRREHFEASARAYDFTMLRFNPIKFATVLFAQEARADEPTVAPAAPEIDLSAIAALFGKGGASALAIAAAITQLLLFIAGKFMKPTAGWQLTLVLVLSLGSTLLTGMTVGNMTFAAALASAPVVAALQVLLNQIIKKSTA